MVDRELALEKIANLRRCEARIRPYLAASSGGFARDLAAQDIVFLNLQRAIQATIDLGAHILADQDWGAAPSQAGVFESLAQHGVMPVALAGRLKRLVKLRNVLVHEYAKVDPRKAFLGLGGFLRDLDRFARAVVTRFRLHER